MFPFKHPFKKDGPYHGPVKCGDVTPDSVPSVQGYPQRWKFNCIKLNNGIACGGAHTTEPDGEWVRWEDVAPLECEGCKQFISEKRISEYCKRCARNPDLVDYFI
jgi:hypothetical protein